MCTELQIKNITKAMAREYRRVYGSDVVDILLFGSYARGDYDDFFIVSKTDAAEQFQHAEEMIAAIENFLKSDIK